MKPNTIAHKIEILRNTLPTPESEFRKTLGELPATPNAELGCNRLEEDFNLRAADLILGMEADQFEGLLDGQRHLCKSIAEDTGDPAYREAAWLLERARNVIHGRKGN